MNWTLLALVGGHLAAVVITARIFLTWEYREQRHLDDDDRLIAAVLGALWPIVAVAFLVYLLARYVWTPLVTPSAVRRDRRAATERKRAEAARLAAMEADLPFPDQDATP